MQGLSKEAWKKKYYLLCVFGVPLAVGLAAVKFWPGVLVGMGLLFVGLGEVYNHVERQIVQQSHLGNVEPRGHVTTREPSWFGLLLDAVGGLLLVIGVVLCVVVAVRSVFQ